MLTRGFWCRREKEVTDVKTVYPEQVTQTL